MNGSVSSRFENVFVLVGLGLSGVAVAGAHAGVLPIPPWVAWAACASVLSALFAASRHALRRQRARPEGISVDALEAAREALHGPQNALQQASALLATSRLETEQAQMVAAIQRAYTELEAQLDALPTCAVAPPPLVLEPFSLRDLIEDVVALFEPPASAKNIGLGYLIDRPLPELYTGDHGRLQQVLVNLLESALRGTGGEILVRASGQVDGDTATLRLSIYNSSEDLAPENSHALAVCDSLIAAMGGQVGADSQGSRWVELPLQVRTQTASRLAAAEKRLVCTNLSPLLGTVLTGQLEALGVESTTCAPSDLHGRMLDEIDIVVIGAEPGRQEGAATAVEACIGGPAVILLGAPATGALRDSIGYAAQASLPVRLSALRNCLEPLWTAPRRKRVGLSPFDPELIDPAAIEEALALGGEATLLELLHVWIDSSDRLMDAMDSALAQSDDNTFKQAIHTLKSSSGSIGAHALHSMLRDMDKMANMGAVPAAGALLPEVRVHWDAVRCAFAAYLEATQGAEAPEATGETSGGPILIVDDDPTMRTLICAALSTLNQPLVTATNGTEALARLDTLQPELVLLDVMMEGVNGFDVCAHIRADYSETIPVLMMTGLDDLSSIQRAYDTGATDFIVKPFNNRILSNRVQYLLRAHKATKALRASQEKIYTLAYTDTVTGLPNRSCFMERLEEAIKAGEHFTVMFADLDRFKRINDTLGHPVGDKLLRTMGERLQVVLNQHAPGALLARFGGDEFVIMHHVDVHSGSDDFARALIEALDQPINIDGNELVVSVSLGMAHHPTNGISSDILLKQADTAMYQIKEQGGSGFQQYIDGKNVDGHRRLELEAALRHALERDEFEVFYQPKHDSRTWEVAGVEALIRWRHPTLGLVSPGQFIPLAEESGLIIAIGDWVLEQSCRDMRPWVLGGHMHRLSVNLSARQFADPNLTERVVSILDRTDFPRDRLELEITETMVVHDIDRTISLMERLRDLGIEIAIDDFGTGQSSLSYLHRFPANCLKIDRAFIRNIGHGTQESPIADMVIALGKALHLRIVAEGVETKEQMSYLCSAGCDELQGFLLSRPMPVADLAQFLAQEKRYAG